MLTTVHTKIMKDCLDEGDGQTCIGLLLDDCTDRAPAPNELQAATWCLEAEALFWKGIAGFPLTEPSPGTCLTNMTKEDQQGTGAITMRDNELARCRRDSFARQALAVLGEGEKLPEDGDFVQTNVQTCFQVAVESGDQGCVGAVSAHCQATIAKGSTTLGIVDCNSREFAAWEAILDAEYKSALHHAAELDAAEPVPPIKAVDMVRKSQQSWLDLRDAQCAMEYARWGNGSMRTIAHSLCSLHMTVERAVSLRTWYQREEGVLP